MATPACRICGKPDAVICFPDDHAQTICPDCCATTEHPDGETGHEWKYTPYDRDHECQKCGVLRRCTSYAEGNHD